MNKYIWKYKLENIWAILLIAISSILITFTSMIHMYALNDLIQGNVQTFIYWYIFDLFLWGVYLFISYISSVYQEKLIQKMLVEIRLDILSAIKNKEYSEYKKESNGTYISWLNNDMKTIDQIGFKSFYSLINALGITATSLIMLLTLDYRIMVATLILTMVIIYTPKFFHKKLQSALSKLTKENEKFTSTLEDVFQGYETLYFSRSLNYLLNKIKKSSLSIGEENVTYSSVNISVNNLIMLISVVSQILIFLLTGLLAHLGKVTFGSVMTTGSLAGNVFSSLSQVSTYRVSISSVSVLFDKYEDYTKTGQNIPSKTNEDIKNFDVNLEDICYSYEGNKVLSNLNLTFKQNKKYVLSGESGSGKSTVLKLISGAIKTNEGMVTIGGRKVIEDNTAHYIQYVSQDSYLFSDTVLNNITLGREINQEKVQELMIDLSLEDIDIHMNIDKKNNNLSGGQKQRINLARGLLSSAEVLLLDEVTSNLDNDTASSIEDIMINYDKTIIFVTHRISDKLLKGFDQIINLNN